VLADDARLVAGRLVLEVVAAASVVRPVLELELVDAVGPVEDGVLLATSAVEEREDGVALVLRVELMSVSRLEDAGVLDTSAVLDEEVTPTAALPVADGLRPLWPAVADVASDVTPVTGWEDDAVLVAVTSPDEDKVCPLAKSERINDDVMLSF
jgi:hypothetical protein